eukprot:UC4_evm1s1390
MAKKFAKPLVILIYVSGCNEGEKDEDLTLAMDKCVGERGFFCLEQIVQDWLMKVKPLALGIKPNPEINKAIDDAYLNINHGAMKYEMNGSSETVLNPIRATSIRNDACSNFNHGAIKCEGNDALSPNLARLVLDKLDSVGEKVDRMEDSVGKKVDRMEKTIDSLRRDIGLLHSKVAEGFDNVRQLTLENENVKCPYIFMLERVQDDPSINKAEKVCDFGSAFRKMKKIFTFATTREKIRNQICEDYELVLLCGVSLKRVVSYRIPTTQLEKYREFLRSIDHEGFDGAQRAQARKSMGLDELCEFDEFLNNVMKEKINAGVPHWNTVLFRAVNQKGQLTFACAKEVENLEKP